MKIYFAAHVHDSEKRQAPNKQPLAQENRETILVVEDEGAILKLTERRLSNLNYNVLIALSPVEALFLSEMNGRELS